MLEIKQFVNDDTETLALMPDLDSAVDWVRSIIDLGLDLEGDIYALHENYTRTLLISKGGRGLGNREWFLLRELLRAIRTEEWSAARRLATRLDQELL